MCNIAGITHETNSYLKEVKVAAMETRHTMNARWRPVKILYGTVDVVVVSRLSGTVLASEWSWPLSAVALVSFVFIVASVDVREVMEFDNWYEGHFQNVSMNVFKQKLDKS